MNRRRLFNAAIVAALMVALAVVTLQAAGVTRISWGSTLPASCLDGNVFVKTGGSAGFKFCQGGSWTDVTGGGGGGAGGLVLLDTQTASASSSLDFTGIDSTYGEYLFSVESLIPTTNGVSLFAVVSTDGGATWLSSNYITSYHYSGSGGAHGAAAIGSLGYWYVVDLIGSATTDGAVGEFRLFRPASSGYKLATSSFVNTSTVDGALYLLTNAYKQPTATAVDALRFYPSSSTFASGSISMYGLEK